MLLLSTIYLWKLHISLVFINHSLACTFLQKVFLLHENLRSLENVFIFRNRVHQLLKIHMLNISFHYSLTEFLNLFKFNTTWLIAKQWKFQFTPLKSTRFCSNISFYTFVDLQFGFRLMFQTPIFKNFKNLPIDFHI